MAQQVQQVGLKNTSIRNLEPFQPNISLVAIVINKTRPNKFTMSDGTERAVFSFTLRDSPTDFINVQCWNKPEIVNCLVEKFQIGDVVEVHCPMIEVRKSSDRGEQFVPVCTSPFKLTLNDGSNVISLESRYFPNLTQLLSLPTKPIANYTTLANINANWQSLSKTQSIDILVAVQNVGETRQVNAKNGPLSVRNVIIFDTTFADFNITLWEPDQIVRASSWQPRLTILFITDLEVSYDSYRKTPRGQLSRRSIITENPLCTQANRLRDYAKHAPIQTLAIVDRMAHSIPDPLTIRKVMKVQEVYDRIEHLLQIECIRDEDKQFTALVYGYVTRLDLDGVSRVLSSRCQRCKSFLPENTEECTNAMCPVVMGIESPEIVTMFDIAVSISDHTGHLNNCKLSDKYAESIFGCTVSDFVLMDDQQKLDLKWKFLLQRCDIRIMVFITKRGTPVITILHCALADANDVVATL